MPITFGKIDVGLAAGAAALETKPADPFHILVIGDFSGRASRGVFNAAEALQKTHRVDRDNFDELPGKLGTALEMAAGANADVKLAMSFSELDDFHPDRLYGRVDVFTKLKDVRSRLENSSTFEDAATEVRSWLKPAVGPEPPPAPAEEASAPPPVNPANLLDQILGETPKAAPAPSPIPGASDWQTFLRRIAEPHMVSTKTLKGQAELVDAVDEVIGKQMRAILHHADFQGLESAWKGLHYLVRHLDSDGPLRLHLLDVSKPELAADLAVDDLSTTSLYRLLVEKTVQIPGGQPWAVLAGLFSFGATAEDAILLGKLAKLACLAGGPFLAEAEPRLFGCVSLAESTDPREWRYEMDQEAREAWQALRKLPESAWAGLAAPRVLLRLPYGKKSDAIDAFEFDEMPEESRSHGSYLWGNPGLACAFLLGKAFERHGWSLRPDAVPQLDGLPLHTYSTDGETEMKPCAEVWLSERGAEAMSDHGIMTMMSIQGMASVRLHRWLSLAEPVQALAGRWQ